MFDDCTLGTQTWMVPAGVTQATFDLFGAEGGDHPNGHAGGPGGHATATVAVNPGETLDVNVGCAGTNATGAGGGASGGNANLGMSGCGGAATQPGLGGTPTMGGDGGTTGAGTSGDDGGRWPGGDHLTPPS